MQKCIAMISMHTCPLAFEEGKETGGMNVYVMELSKELSRKGYIVDIFTRSQSQTQPKIVKINPFLRVIHLIAGPEKPIPKKQVIQHIDAFTENLLAFSKKENLTYDLFHAHYYLSGMVAQKLQQKGFYAPLVITFHTLALMKNLVARDELEKEETSRIDAEIELSQKANVLIAHSITDRDYLRYLYGTPLEKIAVIHPGVNTKLFRPMDQAQARNYIHADMDHKIILFVGRIEPLKGIDTLLYAVKILREKNPKLAVCLFIVGGDVSQKEKEWSKELQKLESLRNVLHVKTSVNFVGQKSQKELLYYYNASDVVVMPSHYESFGMSTLEAIACGAPVITTNVTGIATLIDKPYRRFIASTSSPLLLASQIEMLLTQTNNHEEIRRQLTEHIQNFQWRNVAKKVSRVYKSLL